MARKKDVMIDTEAQALLIQEALACALDTNQLTAVAKLSQELRLLRADVSRETPAEVLDFARKVKAV